MSLEFWQSRWESKQTGFHEGKPHDFLVAHLPELVARAGKAKLRVLVPLAGKSCDLGFLAGEGHDVVGVEFVRLAIDELFEGQAVEEHALGPHRAYTAGGVTMLCEDIFALDPPSLGAFDLIFDRGALVALEPAARQRYVDLCRSLLSPTGTTLLAALAYDQSKTHGPPWSVDGEAAAELFAGRSVEAIDSRSTPPPPRLAAAGVSEVIETAYLIGP